MKIKVYLIDDEAPARRELRYLLKQMDDVEIVGEAPNGTIGLKGIRETRPDLVFLDIQMPGLNGLELSRFLAELPERPLLIFATAYEGYAVQAFEVEACDYLLKPFTMERVRKSVVKAEKSMRKEPPPPSTVSMERKAGTDFCKKIPLYKGEVIVPTAPENIRFARSAEGNIMVHAMDGRYRTKSTLNELEQKLAPHGFIRTHRCFLVNINHVLEVIPWFNGSFKLVMDDREKTEVLVSRYNAKELKKHFDI